MKTNKKRKSLYRVILLSSLCILITTSFLLEKYSNQTVLTQKVKAYQSVLVSFKDTPILEYGQKEYSLKPFIKDVKGELRVERNYIDTSKVGEYLVMFTASNNNTKKNYMLKVIVKDTKAPSIALKENQISISKGQNYSILDNIASVSDEIDGDMAYLDHEELQKEENLNKTNYYTYSTDLDVNKAGNYTANIKAVDVNGNVTEVSYPIVVKETYKIVKTSTVAMNMNFVAEGGKAEVVNAAYSLLGSPYVAGGNSPSGFDCAGFVSYVYGTTGTYISKSSAAQLYTGTSVSLEQMMPGDIIVFSTRSDGSPTHTALYIGGGNMIHAANPRQGVIISNVSAWVSYGASIVSIRRV
ncbi:MAG: C40 family peptidase [Bacilli bacterium]|nr:C40 family peptidase [Bacilli bacterium]